MKSPKFWLSILATVLFLGLCLTAPGQSTFGSISGSILDVTGAAVPGAQVTLVGGDVDVVATPRRVELQSKLVHDGTRDVVLDRRKVLDIAVELARPDRGSAPSRSQATDRAAPAQPARPLRARAGSISPR